MAIENNKENLCRWRKSLILNTFLLPVEHSGWRGKAQSRHPFSVVFFFMVNVTVEVAFL